MKTNRKSSQIDPPPPTPDFLEKMWAASEQSGTDRLTMSEIDKEIAAYRREDQRRKDEAQLEALLMEGINSGPATPMTKKDWQAIKKRGLVRLQKKKSK